MNAEQSGTPDRPVRGNGDFTPRSPTGKARGVGPLVGPPGCGPQPRGRVSTSKAYPDSLSVHPDRVASVPICSILAPLGCGPRSPQESGRETFAEPTCPGQRADGWGPPAPPRLPHVWPGPDCCAYCAHPRVWHVGSRPVDPCCAATASTPSHRPGASIRALASRYWRVSLGPRPMWTSPTTWTCGTPGLFSATSVMARVAQRCREARHSESKCTNAV